jgi:4-carboxymuconolactone decarboxylase
MKTPVAIALSFVAGVAFAAQTPRCVGGSPMMSPESVGTVAPALQRCTHERLLGEVWRRPGLSVRDRSLVTLAVLIARGQSVEMPYYINLALENGVKPSEISEIITHLEFYSGWATRCPPFLPPKRCLHGEASRRMTFLPPPRHYYP